MADSTVKVNFIGDSSRLKRAVDESEGHLGRLGHGIADIAKKAAIGFAAAGAGAAVFAKSAIDAASDLAESQGKVNVVFKEQAKEISDWASKSAKAFGMSKQQALEAAGTYGNLFKAFGLGNKESATMSKSLVELAADLASFNNTSVDDALLALRSGLSGEAEPLKKFGVALTDDRLKLEALKLGLIKTTKEALTPAAKAQASYSLILKDTALAQGDFARTSDGLANKQRILKAQFSDLQAEIGQKLLPVALALAGALSDKVIPAIERIASDPRFKAFIADVGAAAKDVFGWIQEHVPPVLAAIAGFIQDKVIPALQSLAHWVRDDLAPALSKMAASFREEIWPVLEEKVLPALGKLAMFIKDEVLPILGKIVVFIVAELIPAFFKVVNWISTELIPKIAEIVTKIAEIVQEIKDKFDGIVTFITGLPARIKSAASGMWDGIKEAFRETLNWIIRGWNSLDFKIPGFDPPGPGPSFSGFTLGVPDIPELHSGGVFRASRPGGEGLALLRDGERVLTPAQQSGGTTVIFELDGKVLARAVVSESNNSGGLPIRVRAAS